MPHSELSEYNFKRISLINWTLSTPLMFIFGWPYIYAAYPGAFFFSLPLLFTILHGHVTMALGSSHRHHYYNWLTDRPYTYGLFFHNLFAKTRFRLTLLATSFTALFIGIYLRS